eukprot:2521791-Prymnesium_polylepis.1
MSLEYRASSPLWRAQAVQMMGFGRIAKTLFIRFDRDGSGTVSVGEVFNTSERVFESDAERVSSLASRGSALLLLLLALPDAMKTSDKEALARFVDATRDILLGSGRKLFKTAPLGLKWEETGTEKPTKGKQITHRKLAEALESQTVFSQQEWDEFGVKKLQEHDFIKSDESYFKPIVEIAEIVSWGEDVATAADLRKGL